MALSDIKIETRAIAFKGGEFSLVGLSFNELTNILLGNEKEVGQAYALFEKYVGPNAEKGAGAMKEFGVALVRYLPDLTAKLIAAASGEVDQWKVAARLPAPVQLDALIAVAQLTFEEPAAVKKFIENLTLAAKAGSDTMDIVKPMIPNSRPTDRG